MRGEARDHGYRTEIEIVVERRESKRASFINGYWDWRVVHVWGGSDTDARAHVYRETMGDGSALFCGGARRAARRFARKVRREWNTEPLVESA